MNVRSDAYQSALLGIQRGMQGLNQAASEIASAQGDPSSLTKPLVEIIASRQQVEASVEALDRITETLGSLLDIRA